MANQRSRELTCALLLSIAALPAFAADDARRDSPVSQTSDAPRGWSLRNSGMEGIEAHEVAVYAANPSLMFVATYRGVFKTTNAGDEWTLSDDVSEALAVAIAPSNPAVVYASNDAGGRKTTDGGATWTEIRPNPEKLSGATALAIDPSNPSTVYAVLMENGLSKSIDGGATFSYINDGLPWLTYMDWGDFGASALAIDPTEPSTLIAASRDTLKSTNAGASWKPVNGLTTHWGNAIVVDPTQSAFVYAATGKGLYRSSDGGGSWQRLQNELSEEWISDVVVDPSDGRNVYVCTQGNPGVYKSRDRGETWTPMNQGLPAVRVESLEIDSTGRFLAATTSLGVFTWSAGDAITLPPALHAERLDSDPGRLPRLLEQVRALTRDASPGSDERVSSNAGLLFAVAGNAPGALGTYFRSDVTLMSSGAASQEVIAVWLAAGSDGTDAPAVGLTLGRSAVTVSDFIGKMGFSGLGSLLLIGIDSGMNVDAGANLTGFSRIWTAGPDGAGSVSQSLPALNLTSLAGNHAGTAIGLRMDPEYRTNVGVVNLDLKPHAFVVTARGERKTGTFTIAVEPLSMRHVSLPEGDYGEVTAHFEVTGAEFPWAAYGASVDNATGDGWASQAAVARSQQDAPP